MRAMERSARVALENLMQSKLVFAMKILLDVCEAREICKNVQTYSLCLPFWEIGLRSHKTMRASLFCSSPRAKGVGKEEKNPLWAVHAPGHTGVSDFHRLKTS
ncbi:hypothetical protein EVAR_55248_1 [Eumeta japonica]|uniref:Uncharacterized protein n=1 Tax=Eumeta variegata TaxID=151549 RepID=A0A4C1Y7L5_EUMVA|nr:hypothetical protein EVAR_55248_1 [Eumeta japonica]